MQTLILPGYSKTNKEWVDETVKNLKIDGIIRPFYWMHWTDETAIFDPQEKAGLIIKHLKGEKTNIIAKSLGTLVASLVCKMIPNQIEKVILNGIPLRDINSEELEIIKSAIRLNKDKIIVFQNNNDPHGTFEDVKDFGNVVMKEGNDHNYPFFVDFQGFLS